MLEAQLTRCGCSSEPSLAFDRVKQRMEIVSIVLTEEAAGSHARLRELYDAAVARTLQLENKIYEASLPQPARRETDLTEKSFQLNSNWTRRDFEEGVRRVQDYIRAGDCYQAVLSQRFSAKFKGEAWKFTEPCARLTRRLTCSFFAWVVKP